MKTGEGAAEVETVGSHYRLSGHEFEQTPEESEGQGILAYCSPWRGKQSDTMPEQRQWQSIVMSLKIRTFSVKFVPLSIKFLIFVLLPLILKRLKKGVF